MVLFLFINALLIPFSMMILGKRWSKKPPKDRYGMSGYRTSRSVLNDDTWKYAHRCWGKVNYYVGVLLVVITIIVLMIVKYDRDLETIVIYIVFIQLGIFILTSIPVEILLNRAFDQDGHRR